MQLKTYSEGINWFKSLHHQLDSESLIPECPFTATFQIPTDAGRKTGLARNIVNHLFQNETIVFLTDEMGIWPSCENKFLFQSFRDHYAQPKDIDEYTFHIIASDENEVAE